MNPSSAPSSDARRLTEIAPVIRSKNAGPTQLTIDIFLRDSAGYAQASESAALSCEAVAQRYGLPASLVRRFLLPDILAIKFSLPRQICAGSPGDGDVYGAQQHGPMLEILL